MSRYRIGFIYYNLNMHNNYKLKKKIINALTNLYIREVVQNDLDIHNYHRKKKIMNVLMSRQRKDIVYIDLDIY